MGKLQQIIRRRSQQIREELSRHVLLTRDERGLTQEDLAARANVSRRTIIRIESRSEIPSPEVVARLERALES